MKKYRVKRTFMADPENPHEEINEEAMDLINIKDESDRIMCAPNEFTEGEIVCSNDFEIITNAYVDDHGTGNAPFAFKLTKKEKKSKKWKMVFDIIELLATLAIITILVFWLLYRKQ